MGSSHYVFIVPPPQYLRLHWQPRTGRCSLFERSGAHGPLPCRVSHFSTLKLLFFAHEPPEDVRICHRRSRPTYARSWAGFRDFLHVFPSFTQRCLYLPHRLRDQSHRPWRGIISSVIPVEGSFPRRCSSTWLAISLAARIYPRARGRWSVERGQSS